MTHSIINFEPGVVPNSQELVGNGVVIDLVELTLSIKTPEGTRYDIPLSKLTRVELEEQPRIRDHSG